MVENWLSFIWRILLKLLIGVNAGGWSQKLLSFANENKVEINQVKLTLPRLDTQFNGYRLVQISDIHIGTWINRQRLLEAIRLINDQQPDLVAITGDFVTLDPEEYANDMITAFCRISSRDGTVAVLGNHDHWAGKHEIRRILNASGVNELRNSICTLRRGEAQLHIAGVDSSYIGFDRLDRVLGELPAEGAAILLAHEPDFADTSAKSGRFDLQLSGHTHGGQIRLPRLGPPFLPRHGRKYSIGYNRVGEMHLYTNRGLGTGKVQLRLNCRPEITVFTLQAANGKEPPSLIVSDSQPSDNPGM